MSVSNKWQPAVVLGMGGLRVLANFMIERKGLCKKNRLSVKSFVYIGLIVDLMYETYSRTLFVGAKSGAALALPPLMDFCGNLGSMAIIWLVPVNPATQFAFLVSLAMREFMELISSLGTMTVISSVWYFNRFDYYVIDVASEEAIRNTCLMSIFDFFSELAVLFVFDRMVHKVWEVSLIDLAQAFIRSTGRWEMFFLTCSCTIYMFMFGNYHYGSDYFFNFEWMTEENLLIAEMDDGTPTFCDILQEQGKSCYNWKGLNETIFNWD